MKTKFSDNSLAPKPEKKSLFRSLKDCSCEPIKGAEHLWNQLPKDLIPEGIAQHTRYWTYQGQWIENITACGSSGSSRQRLEKAHKHMALWQKYLLLSGEFPNGMPPINFKVIN